MRGLAVLLLGTQPQGLSHPVALFFGALGCPLLPSLRDHAGKSAGKSGGLVRDIPLFQGNLGSPWPEAFQQ